MSAKRSQSNMGFVGKVSTIEDELEAKSEEKSTIDDEIDSPKRVSCLYDTE